MKKPQIKYYGDLKGVSPRPLVLGIDQSYSGFAMTFMAKDGEPHFSSYVYKADGSGVDRLLKIQDFITSTVLEIKGRGFTVVDSGLEGYAYGAQMAHMAGELGGMVKTTLRKEFTGDATCPLIIPPAMVKKYVTGKGTGIQKNQMLLQIFIKYSEQFDDDNVADSYAIARMVSGRASLAYEKEVLKKLSDPKFREKPAYTETI